MPNGEVEFRVKIKKNVPKEMQPRQRRSIRSSNKLAIHYMGMCEM